jgi:hypothetical protein
LFAAGFRDGTDKQGLYSETRIVDLLLGEARIYHIHYPIDGQRSLSNIGGHYDLATRNAILVLAWSLFEDSLLLLRR